MPVGNTSQSHRQSSSSSSDDLPKNVVMTLDQGSAVKSMDFHPVQQMLLLVGTNSGDIILWELHSRSMLAVRTFKVWDVGENAMRLQELVTKNGAASVHRVVWSPDGSLCGVAYSMSIVHIYSYHGRDELRHQLQIEAHLGSVNDLAFCYRNRQPYIITCGDDRLTKVWDAVTGANLYTLAGHEAPVHCVLPRHSQGHLVIYSTGTDGKVNRWMDGNFKPRTYFPEQDHLYIKLAFSAVERRLFMCATNAEGYSTILGFTSQNSRHEYLGLTARSIGIVQFDITRNQYLAAGHESMVKFWNMDNANILTTTDANGGLPDSPCIRFNKGGTLLDVSTKENGLKILANPDGLVLLGTVEDRPFDTSRAVPAAVVKDPAIGTAGAANATVESIIEDRANPVNEDYWSLEDLQLGIADERHEKGKSRVCEQTIVSKPTQCRRVMLPDTLTSTRVARLIFTNSGCSILALYPNGLHKLWKWQGNNLNLALKATASVVPKLWQPSVGIEMVNDLSERNLEDSVSCFALSKEDAYVVSASGGKVSLFYLTEYMRLHTSMPPPPAVTFLAFHPDDSKVIVVGMEDGSILLISVDGGRMQVETTLEGHQKRISGLDFSNSRNILVSSGADSQLCVWDTDGWKKQTYKYLPIPAGKDAPALVDTRVKFHLNQLHVLVVHVTHIAIYDTALECLKQWVPQDLITDGTYSCDCQSIYVCFVDGSISVLSGSTLQLCCKIKATSYQPSLRLVMEYPCVVAAHPSEPHQFAVGLTDGNVCVLEPLDSEGEWGTSPKNGAGPSTARGATTSERP